MGNVVVTVSDNLVVRSQPRVSSDSTMYAPLLPLGTELQVWSRPVSASGYTWYEVRPVSFELRDFPGLGFVAAAGKDGEPWIGLASGGFIEGLVTGVDGAPLAGISVQACDYHGWCPTATTAPETTGSPNFRLGPLGTGLFRVSFFDPESTYAAAFWVPGGYTSTPGGVPVSVTEGTVARVDMRMPLANRVVGTVTGQGNVPLAGVGVVVTTPEGLGYPPGLLSSTTAVDGTFEVRGVGRGTYIVQLYYPVGSTSVSRYYTLVGDSTDRDWAIPVTVGGSDVRIDPRLPVEADSCGRPTEAVRGWVFQATPFSCSNGSPRRAEFGGQELHSVVGAGPGFVALGWREFAIGSVPEAAALTSADGATWAAVRVDPRVSGHLAAGHGWIVAVGPGTGGRSRDGISWQAATAPPSGASSIAAVTADGAGFVAIGQRPQGAATASVWTSGDGLRWRQVPDQEAFDHFCAQSVAAGLGGFVASGSDCHSRNAASAVIITSADGRSWRRVPSQAAFAGNARVSSVIPGGPGFIAAGDYRRPGGRWGTGFWTSPDGRSWRRVGFYTPLAAAHWIVRTPEGFEVVSDQPGLSYVSRDGTTWSHGMPGVPVWWTAMDAAASGSKVIIVGTYSSPAGTSPAERGGLVLRQVTGA